MRLPPAAVAPLRRQLPSLLCSVARLPAWLALLYPDAPPPDAAWLSLLSSVVSSGAAEVVKLLQLVPDGERLLLAAGAVPSPSAGCGCHSKDTPPCDTLLGHVSATVIRTGASADVTELLALARESSEVQVAAVLAATRVYPHRTLVARLCRSHKLGGVLTADSRLASLRVSFKRSALGWMCSLPSSDLVVSVCSHDEEAESVLRTLVREAGVREGCPEVAELVCSGVLEHALTSARSQSPDALLAALRPLDQALHRLFPSSTPLHTQPPPPPTQAELVAAPEPVQPTLLAVVSGGVLRLAEGGGVRVVEVSTLADVCAAAARIAAWAAAAPAPALVGLDCEWSGRLLPTETSHVTVLTVACVGLKCAWLLRMEALNQQGPADELNAALALLLCAPGVVVLTAGGGHDIAVLASSYPHLPVFHSERVRVVQRIEDAPATRAGDMTVFDVLKFGSAVWRQGVEKGKVDPPAEAEATPPDGAEAAAPTEGGATSPSDDADAAAEAAPMTHHPASLTRLCAHFLGGGLSKYWQISAWDRPVLIPSQAEYAALDALVLEPLVASCRAASEGVGEGC